MNETWVKEICTECQVINWVCMGDLEDCTSSTGEGGVVKCWKCNKRFWREGVFEDMDALECGWWYDKDKTPNENLRETGFLIEGLERPD